MKIIFTSKEVSMDIHDYHQFLTISGVSEKYIDEAVSFIQKGGYGAAGRLYKGESKADRLKHLSLLMMNKYLDLLGNSKESKQILKWWNEVKSVNQSIKGDLHIHTIYSDGTGTLNELVKLAEQLGYKWIGFSDHSPLFGNNLRLNNKKFKDRHKQILQLRESSDLNIYESIEADISSEGSLMFPDSWRDFLDFVIISLHEDVKKNRMVLKRIEKALKDPLVVSLSHPYYGLQDNISDSYIKELLQIVKSSAKAIEINLTPQFLIQNLKLTALCRKNGVPIVFSSDSHFVDSLYLMKFASIYYPDLIESNILNLQDSIDASH